MNCAICGEPIILRPTAAERARKFGGVPADYTRLFTEHAACTLEKRNDEVRELIARQNKG
jgi:hypothetical protein